MKDYDVTAARGFIDLFGLPMKVRGMKQGRGRRHEMKQNVECKMYNAECRCTMQNAPMHSMHR